MYIFKFDENISPLCRSCLEEKGHKVSTVYEENIQGTKDQNIAAICKTNQFIIVTMDIGFSNLIHYPPQEYAGIIVLRHPDPNLEIIQKLLMETANHLEHEEIINKLWIIEIGRVRIHEGL